MLDPPGTRYERFAAACWYCHLLAKKRRSAVILLSQAARSKDDRQPHEIILHDALDAPSFASSCSMVLGLWKINRAQMRCRVVKNSRGLSGNTVTMDIRGGTFVIDPAEG